MKKRNTEFRKEMEETSARVMEMVELVPVTRAHALEDEEVHKMSGQLFAVAEKGYKLDLVQALFGSVGWAVFQVFQVVCLAFTGYLAYHAGDITDVSWQRDEERYYHYSLSELFCNSCQSGVCNRDASPDNRKGN